MSTSVHKDSMTTNVMLSTSDPLALHSRCRVNLWIDGRSPQAPSMSFRDAHEDLLTLLS